MQMIYPNVSNYFVDDTQNDYDQYINHIKQLGIPVLFSAESEIIYYNDEIYYEGELNNFEINIDTLDFVMFNSSDDCNCLKHVCDVEISNGKVVDVLLLRFFDFKEKENLEFIFNIKNK